MRGSSAILPLMRGRLAPALVFVLVGTVVAAAPQDAGQPTDVLRKLDAYFETYHEALGRLVADERLVQTIGGASAGDVSGRWQPVKLTREIQSEVAFIDLPGDAGWLGFRDVLKVSNKTVRKPGPSLSEALLKGGTDKYASALALLLASAAHNLGAPRTTNLPNVALELLHNRNRWRYDGRIDGHERVHGHDTTIVVLDEKASPTIIQRPDGGDIVARVMAWVEPDTGRLWRTHLRLTDSRVLIAEGHAPTDTQVDYVEHDELGLLVPERMTENFYVHGSTLGRGEARYSNFRRFTTDSRIVPEHEWAVRLQIPGS